MRNDHFFRNYPFFRNYGSGATDPRFRSYSSGNMFPYFPIIQELTRTNPGSRLFPVTSDMERSLKVPVSLPPKTNARL
jgi:hypothetical protein